MKEFLGRALQVVLLRARQQSKRALALWGAVLLLFMARIVIAARLPLVPDEAYYWIWSRHVQWGYLDHPFMVALWGRVGVWCLGDHPLGLRLCGLLASLCESALMYGAAKRFFPERENIGTYAVLLLNGTLAVGIGLLPLTPDAPLIFFVCVMLWALAHALVAEGRSARCAWWAGVGLSLGLAIESKYTAILLAVGLCGFVVADHRALWRQVGPWVGAVCSFVVCLPVIGWNITHDWAGFLKQGGRTAVWHPQRAVQFLSELWAGQFALITPWIACLFCVGLWRARQQMTLLLWLWGPGFTVFVFHACGDRVQANWVWILYPVAVLAAAAYARCSIKGGLSGMACVALLYGQLLTNVLPLPPHWNPVVRLTAGWKGLAEGLAIQAQQQGVKVIATDDYALASILFFYKPAGLSVVGLDHRWVFIDALPVTGPRKALYVEDAHYGPVAPGEQFIMRNHGQQVVRYYRLKVRDITQGSLLR